MVKGPPTPPPTTAAEIQDEARIPTENVATSSTSQTVSPAAEDAYRVIFPRIADLASKSNLAELIHFSEKFDVNSDANTDRSITRLLVTAPLVLAYMIIDDLPPARFTLTRLPDNVSSTPFGKAIAQLLISAWDRNHANVYTRAERLLDLVRQPNLFDERLVPVITTLVARFVESFRQRTISLLSKAYTSLPVSLAQTYLGVGKDELLSVTQNAHWSYESSSNIIVPRIPFPIASTIPESKFSSLSSFHFVANSVAKLEL